jgi:hypothetical protein
MTEVSWTELALWESRTTLRRLTTRSKGLQAASPSNQCVGSNLLVGKWLYVAISPPTYWGINPYHVALSSPLPNNYLPQRTVCVYAD